MGVCSVNGRPVSVPSLPAASQTCFCACWTPAGQSFVTCSIHNLYGHLDSMEFLGIAKGRRESEKDGA